MKPARSIKIKPCIFLDTSALFAGIWSAQGGARMLLKLGEAEAVQLLVSPQVLGEIEAVIRRKSSGQLPILTVLLDRSRLEIIQSAREELLENCRILISHPGDAHILADAWNGEANYLVMLDRAHLLGNPALASVLPFIIGTPGDCLYWYRNALRNP